MTILHRAQWIFDSPTENKFRHWQGGALAVQNGKVLGIGKLSELKKQHPKSRVIDHGKHSIITPGFADCHVHAPQLEMMGSAGFGLLEWLEKHTFPTEMKYANLAYAKKQWSYFCDALLMNGTTSAAIYSSNHTAATEELLKTCARKKLRAFVGQSLMDRNAPKSLLQPAEKSIEDFEKSVARWKSHARVKPILTIRFAPTSSEKLLKLSGQVAQKYSDVLIQTHLGETVEEIKWVKEVFPKINSYTGVYEDFDLLTSRTLLGHCIYLEKSEIDLIKKRNAQVIHCPSSNLFLGSGLFDLKKMRDGGVAVALGSDVAGGFDLSMQTTARCCYEVQALQKQFVKPAQLLYLATKAGTTAMGLSNVGDFSQSAVADFVVHDFSLNKLALGRLEQCEDAEEVLSVNLFCGNSTTVASTYIEGEEVYAAHKSRLSKKR